MIDDLNRYFNDDLNNLVSKVNYISTRRDITIINFSEDFYLIIGCDVSGAIGTKPGDRVEAPGEIVGRFTTRVALMEVLAVGAKPISIVNTLTTDLENGGREIVNGISQLLQEIGLSDNILTGSTENNMITRETGLGVTVIGMVEKDKLCMNNTEEDDLIVTLGLPMVGEKVLANKEQIAELDDLITLKKSDLAHEIIPVGSKGIKYEAELLTEMSGLGFKKVQKSEIDLTSSAGPATVLVFSLPPANLSELEEIFFHKPLNVIGRAILP